METMTSIANKLDLSNGLHEGIPVSTDGGNGYGRPVFWIQAQFLS